MERQIEGIKDVIINSFSFLEKEFAFSLEVDEIADSIFEEEIIIRYTNEILRRKISVTTTLGINDDVKTYSIGLVIVRLPYTGIRDLFVLSDFVKSKGESISVNFTFEFDLNKVKQEIEALAKALINHAEEIVKGNLWLETFYPRW